MARAQGKKRSCDEAFDDGGPQFLAHEREQRLHAKRNAGAALLQHFKNLYALGKMTAADFCIGCYHASAAGIIGADFAPFAYPPGLQSGRYQKELDKIWAPPANLDTILVPGTDRRRTSRQPRTVLVALTYENIASEVRGDQCKHVVDESNGLPPVYWEHPLTIAAKSQGKPLPIPLALHGRRALHRQYVVKSRFDVGVLDYECVNREKALVCSMAYASFVYMRVQGVVQHARFATLFGMESKTIGLWCQASREVRWDAVHGHQSARSSSYGARCVSGVHSMCNLDEARLERRIAHARLAQYKLKIQSVPNVQLHKRKHECC